MIVDQKDAKKLQLWSGRLGDALLVLVSCVTLYAGWIWGGGLENIAKAVIFAGIMGITPWVVASLTSMLFVARAAGRSAYGLAAIVAIAGMMEWQGEMMVFAGHRNTSSVNATMQQARYEDARKSVAVLEKQLTTAQAKLDEQTPYGTSASYAAQIKDADDLAAREGSKERSGCKAKCDQAKAKAADLRAKEAIAKDRETNTEPTVNRLTKELADAKAVAGSTKAGDSMSGAQVVSIATLWSMSLDPSRDAQRWTDLWMGAFAAFFLLLIPTALKVNSVVDFFSQPKPRKRNGLFARLNAWMNGEKIEPVEPIREPAPATVALTVPPIEKRWAPPSASKIATLTVADLLRPHQAAA